MLLLFIYITRLASSEIFSPSNKVHGEVGRAKDLSAPLCCEYGKWRSPGLELLCTWGYIWVAIYRGVVNTESWSFWLGAAGLADNLFP